MDRGFPDSHRVTSIACAGVWEFGRWTSCAPRNGPGLAGGPSRGETEPRGVATTGTGHLLTGARPTCCAPSPCSAGHGGEHASLLSKQLDEAREADGPPDFRKLLLAVSAAYAEWDDERRGVVRSMKLLADETTAAAREIRENAAVQLQAIVDHVKDAILTVDEIGRIETHEHDG